MENASRFSIWKVIVVFVALATLVGISYAVYAATSGRGEVALGQDERIVSVQRGEFLKQVTISGSLAFPNSESLLFSTQGTVGEVLVRQGDLVEAGQLLASLDGVAVVTLQKAVAQAQRDLKAAQAKLDEATKTNEEERAAYRQVFRKWLGIDLTDEQLEQDPATLLASWGADLAVLFDPDKRFDDINNGWFAGGVPPDDPETPWSEPLIYSWLNLVPGVIQGVCDPDLPLDDGMHCVQREMEDAWAVLGGSESDPLELATLEADVILAQAALQEAEKKLEGAQIIAPFDGIVTQVTVSVGSRVDGSAPAVRIIDSAVIELVGAVDQVDILYVHQGADALVTLDALPGVVLPGTVSSVAASADDQQGFISYPVRVRVPAPEGMVFPEGLTGTARIVLSRESDVLMVPINAIRGTFDRPVVNVVQNGRVVEREVVLGDSDDFWTVVVEGLSEGEEVVISGDAPSDPGFPSLPGFPEGGINRPGQPGVVRPLPVPGGGGSSSPGVIIIEEDAPLIID